VRINKYEKDYANAKARAKTQGNAAKITQDLIKVKQEHLKTDILWDESSLKRDLLKVDFYQNKDEYNHMTNEAINLLDTVEDTIRTAVSTSNFTFSPKEGVAVYFFDSRYDYPIVQYPWEVIDSSTYYLDFKDTNVILAGYNNILISFDHKVLENMWDHKDIIASYFGLKKSLERYDAYSLVLNACGVKLENIKTGTDQQVGCLPYVFKMSLLTSDEIKDRVEKLALALHDNK